MIDKESARQIAYDFVNSPTYRIHTLDECVILDEHTIEKEYGWIFFYQSRKFIETRDYLYMLFGNGPIVIAKSDGSIDRLGAVFAIEKEIERYDASRKLP